MTSRDEAGSPQLTAPWSGFAAEDIDACRARFREDGAVKISGLVDAHAVESLRAAYRSHADTLIPVLQEDVHYEADGSSVRVANELQKYHPVFKDALEDAKMMDFVERVTGWEPRPMYAEYFPKEPFGMVANPHQDTAFEVVHPQQYVHVWIALTRISDDMGPLSLWLGSQSGPPLPHLSTDPSGFQYIEDSYLPSLPRVEGVMEAGDAILFDTGCIHASGVNTSAASRASLVLAYRGADTFHEGHSR